MSDEVIACPKQLNITMAEGFKEKLMPFADKGDSCSVDAAEVEKVDSTGLQLLVALDLTLKSNGAQLSVLNPSDVFLKTAQMLGLTEHLNLVEAK